MKTRLAELIERLRVPGASLAYWHGGETHHEVAGVLNRDTGVAVTPDAVFQFGSVTKVWTTAQIMLLAEQGRLTLDTPVADLLPSIGGGVTVRQLLCHTSGIDGDFFHDTGRGDDCLERYVADVAERERIHEPGAVHSYSNSGFVIAGRIVELLTGKTWDAALREQIIEPLGLARTMTLPEDVLRFRSALGHPDGPPSPVWGLMRSTGPAGLICSTPGDMVAFGRSFLEGTLLSADSVAAMATRQIALPDTAHGTHWGLGWTLDTWQGKDVWMHGGNTIGQSSMLWVVPSTGTVVALVSNGGDESTLARTVADELFPSLAGITPPAPPLPTWALTDLTPFEGVYERTGVRMTISGTSLTYEHLGDLTGMLEFELAAESTTTALARRVGEESWHRLVFASMPDGRPYAYFAARSTPKLP